MGSGASGWHFEAVKARARSRAIALKPSKTHWPLVTLVGWVLASASVGVLGWVGYHASRPAPVIEMAGVREVVPPDYAVIDKVLTRRGPGLGLQLRRQLALAISEESARAGFDPLLVLALIDVESDFKDGAISSVGAKGLMQIRPTTLYFLAQKEGLTLSREEVEKDTALQVRLGVRYLKSLHDKFGDLNLALMAYNCGPNRLIEAAKNKELDLYRGYVQAVRSAYGHLRRSEGLDQGWAMAVVPSSAAGGQ